MLIARIEDYKGHVRMAYPKKNESDAQFISRLNNNFTYKLNGVRSIKFIEPLDASYNKKSSFNYINLLLILIGIKYYPKILIGNQSELLSVPIKSLQELKNARV